MIQPGTAVWFARHESRLAWRDWVAMMTAGKAARRRRVALGIAAFVIGMLRSRTLWSAASPPPSSTSIS
jgi:beta-lactamase regulating signal transducer with metallopeptidase domain